MCHPPAYFGSVGQAGTKRGLEMNIQRPPHCHTWLLTHVIHVIHTHRPICIFEQAKLQLHGQANACWMISSQSQGLPVQAATLIKSIGGNITAIGGGATGMLGEDPGHPMP
jgi:hypothetical protein